MLSKQLSSTIVGEYCFKNTVFNTVTTGYVIKSCFQILLTPDVFQILLQAVPARRWPTNRPKKIGLR